MGDARCRSRSSIIEQTAPLKLRPHCRLSPRMRWPPSPNCDVRRRDRDVNSSRPECELDRSRSAVRVCPLHVDSGRPLRAHTGRSPTARRTGHIDPLLPFQTGPMNGRIALNSGRSATARPTGQIDPLLPFKIGPMTGGKREKAVFRRRRRLRTGAVFPCAPCALMPSLCGEGTRDFCLNSLLSCKMR